MSKNQRFWDRLAAQSKNRLGPTSQKTIEKTRPWLHAEDQILDIGCGAGTLTIELARRVQRVEAIDLSPAMIEKARSFAQEAKMESIHFQVGTVEGVHFPASHFDAIITYNVLHHIPDLSSFVQRVSPWLKPGGLFISATPFMGDQWSVPRMVLPLFSGLGLLPRIHYLRKSDFLQEMEHFGFEKVHESKLSSLPEYLLVLKRKNPGGG